MFTLLCAVSSEIVEYVLYKYTRPFQFLRAGIQTPVELHTLQIKITNFDAHTPTASPRLRFQPERLEL